MTLETFPMISVLFITYKRIDLLTQTIRSFLKHTTYPRDKMELIVCDDGSSQEIQDEIRKLPFDIYILPKENKGMGGNVNQGLNRASGQFILQLQDDWVMKMESDYLTLGISALKKYEDIKLIRFTQMAQPYKWETPFRPIANGQAKIICQKETAPECYFFAYSDQPHLKRRQFHEKFGFYLEGQKMELTEQDMCKKFLQKGGKTAFIEGQEDVFFHIGEAHSFRVLTLRGRILQRLMAYPLGKSSYLIYSKVKKTLFRS